MLFNSINFLFFLPLVFVLYWFVTYKKLFYQNSLLLISSFFFYACWDWRFLFLLIFSILLDYITGIKMGETNRVKVRKFWFWLSIIINVGFLAIFKYYNFFVESLSQSLSLIGLKTNFWTLQVILPVGISFYTFHGLSYVIDIYYDRIKPEKNFVDYAVFVSFFPLLVAGPIERATHLLPQIKKQRKFDYSQATDGLRQILWGLFKKIVIADNCAELANLIFNNANDYNGSTLFLGALFFTFQIYCDFSGYSDIALGTARLFGIDLLRNFAFPYFSRDIAEFWRRWHISLSSWFKDYLYIPLGGSKGGIWMKIRNTFIIFLVSGFWHGSNWTFIIWGLLNALYIMPSIIFNTNRNNIEIVAKGRFFPSLKDFFSIVFTFLLTVFAWIFFRAESVTKAIYYIKGVFSVSFFSKIQVVDSKLFVLLFLFMLIEWQGRANSFAIYNIKSIRLPIIRKILYSLILIVIYLFGNTDVSLDFIYFQF